MLLIRILSTASVLAFAKGFRDYIRSQRDLHNDDMGRAMALWIVVAWAAIGLIPGLVAAGLTIARYSELGGPTRVVGLLPAGILLILLLPFAGLWAWAFVVLPLAEANKRQRPR
jgi:hypothetical protein